MEKYIIEVVFIDEVEGEAENEVEDEVEDEGEDEYSIILDDFVLIIVKSELVLVIVLIVSLVWIWSTKFEDWDSISVFGEELLIVVEVVYFMHWLFEIFKNG